jgi:hypothetical protein
MICFLKEKRVGVSFFRRGVSWAIVVIVQSGEKRSPESRANPLWCKKA